MPTDVEALATIQNDGWRETYGAQLPPRFYDEVALARRHTMWEGLVDHPPDQVVVRVAVVSEQVAGFGVAGTPTDNPSADHTRQLFSLYVALRYQGLGVGSRLLEAVVGGYPAQLWVAESNARAIAFYERHGFRPDGHHQVDRELDDLVEVRLARRRPPPFS